MKELTVVGMGPGSPAYLLPAATTAIDSAEMLAGAARHLDLCPSHKPRILFHGDVASFLNEVAAALEDHSVALLVSGDPCLYSLRAAVARRFGRDAYKLVPGISSFQLACARAKIAYDDATFASVHGRPLEELDRAGTDRPLIVFLGGSHTPSRVASRLAKRLGSERRCVVAERLGYEDERLVESSLSSISTMTFSSLCLLIVFSDDEPTDRGHW